jgi:hypothetical protein
MLYQARELARVCARTESASAASRSRRTPVDLDATRTSLALYWGDRERRVDFSDTGKNYNRSGILAADSLQIAPPINLRTVLGCTSH